MSTRIVYPYPFLQDSYPYGQHTYREASRFAEEAPGTIGFYVKQSAPVGSLFKGTFLEPGESVEMTTTSTGSSLIFNGYATLKDFTAIAENLDIRIYPNEPIEGWFKVPFVNGIKLAFPTEIDATYLDQVFEIKYFIRNGNIVSSSVTSPDRPAVATPNTVYHLVAPTTGYHTGTNIYFDSLANGTFSSHENNNRRDIYTHSYTKLRIEQSCPTSAVCGFQQIHNPASGSWGDVLFHIRTNSHINETSFSGSLKLESGG